MGEGGKRGERESLNGAGKIMKEKAFIFPSINDHLCRPCHRLPFKDRKETAISSFRECLDLTYPNTALSCAYGRSYQPFLTL